MQDQLTSYNRTEPELNNTQWYISINLRVHRNNTNDNVNYDGNNSLVMGVKIKKSKGINGSGKIDNGYINFSHFPDGNNLDETLHNYKQRGWAYSLNPLNGVNKEFKIYKSMLPYNNKVVEGVTLDNNVTISAKFICDKTFFKELTPTTNLKLQQGLFTAGDVKAVGYLTDLMIEVYYYGGADIEIDWIRIESENARDLYWGRFDNPLGENINYVTRLVGNPFTDPDNYVNSYSIFDAAQFLLDYFGQKNTFRFFRFYANGGDDGLCLYNWGAMRYMSKLLDGNIICSHPASYYNEYNQYVNPTDRWVATPYPGGCSPAYGPNHRQRLSNSAMAVLNNYSVHYGFSESGGYRGSVFYWMPYDHSNWDFTIEDPYHFPVLQNHYNNCDEDNLILFDKNSPLYGFQFPDTLNSWYETHFNQYLTHNHIQDVIELFPADADWELKCSPIPRDGKVGWPKANSREFLDYFRGTMDYNYFSNPGSPLSNEDYYLKQLIRGPGFLGTWEYKLYSHFINPIDRSYNVLFDKSKNWFAQMFVVSNWGLLERINTHTFIDTEREDISYFRRTYVGSTGAAARQETAEECRLLGWTNLILGAKGFCYDRLFTDPPPPLKGTTKEPWTLPSIEKLRNWMNGHASDPNSNPWFAIGLTSIIDNQDIEHDNNQTLRYESAISDDQLGSDFLVYDYKQNDPSDPIQHDNSNLDSYIDIDSLSIYMGVPKHRIYLGRKSQRIELNRLHEYILASHGWDPMGDLTKNKAGFLDLQLISWYAKGFKTWENWMQDYGNLPTDNPLRYVLNLDGIRTRKLFDPMFEGLKEYDYRDSSFFDITMLVTNGKNNKGPCCTDKVGNAPNNSESFDYYIGIVNRRTDPLIHYSEPKIDMNEDGDFDDVVDLDLYRDDISTGCDTRDYMMFLSKNEFEELCDLGGPNPYHYEDIDKPKRNGLINLYDQYMNIDMVNGQPYFHRREHWRDLWDKRLGIREFWLPFNTQNYDWRSKYIEVEEFGIDPAITGIEEGFLPLEPFWRQDKLNNIIGETFVDPNDGIIKKKSYSFYANQPLIFRLLPGEGKIIHVKVKNYIHDDDWDAEKDEDGDWTEGPPCKCDDILPQKYAGFTDEYKDQRSGCLGFGFNIYPCPNQLISGMTINLKNLPSCLSKSGVSLSLYTSNQGFIDEGFTRDFSDDSESVNIQLSNVNNEKSIKYWVRLCPPPMSEFDCTKNDEWDSMEVSISFNGIQCEKKLVPYFYCKPNPDYDYDPHEDDTASVKSYFFKQGKPEIYIKPNPANSNLIIDLHDFQRMQNLKLAIYDMKGNLLYNKLYAEVNTVFENIDLKHFINGCYIITLSDPFIFYGRRLFIVEK